MTDYAATRIGGRTTVRHDDRWTVTHTAGARLAHINDMSGALIDAVQVVQWAWSPDGRPHHPTSTATDESLSAALLKYVADHAGDEQGLTITDVDDDTPHVSNPWEYPDRCRSMHFIREMHEWNSDDYPNHPNQ